MDWLGAPLISVLQKGQFLPSEAEKEFFTTPSAVLPSPLAASLTWLCSHTHFITEFTALIPPGNVVHPGSDTVHSQWLQVHDGKCRVLFLHSSLET